MTDFLFQFGNLTALAGWTLLIMLPRWRGVARAAATFVVPTLLAIAYTALIAGWWSRGVGGFGSLAEVQALFETPELLLAGWLHYLAFDLFVGAWISRQLHRGGVPHLVVIPLLVLTFLFGPAGYLASLAVRVAWRVGRLQRASVAPSGHLARMVAVFANREPRLAAAALLCFLTAMPMVVAAAIDTRTVDGAMVWIKPLKFQISVGIYLGTLAFFFPLAGDGFRRTIAGRYVIWVSIVTSVFELIYISWRASRGEASHFNVATPAGMVLYGLMGIAALALAAAGPVLAWGVSRAHAKLVHPVYRMAVVFGLMLTFALGAMGGVVMASGTGHFVGQTPPDAGVIPLVGWSRSVGDLRVAHFLGLHAQQIIPLFGALAVGRWGHWARSAVITFVVLFAFGTIALFVQALGGHPFLPG